MYVLIRYPGEIIVEGMMLARGNDRLRVAAPGFPDAVEMKRVGATWTTCGGEVVDIDFVMSNEHQSQGLPGYAAQCAAAVVRQA